MPCIFSDHKLGMLDPHERYFSTRQNRRTGKVWNFERQGDYKLLKKYIDQFKPFQNMFDKTLSLGYCQGTLFRFPLRHSPSDLSQTLYSDEKVSTLFNSFKNEGQLSLLFMKNLETIEFYRRSGSNGRVELLFSFSVGEECLKTQRIERQEFLEDLREAQREKKPQTISKTFEIAIVSKSYREDQSSGIQKYLVSQRYDGMGFQKEVSSFSETDRQSLFPFVGVAYPLEESSEITEPQGRIFCALPLPAQARSPTGLPVHINGFFSLGPDRKDLKWLSAAHDQQARVSDKQILWNQFLINSMIPYAYVELIEELICRSKPSETVYKAWPILGNVTPNWRSLVKPTLTKLLSATFLKTEAHRGKWLKIEDVVFMSPTMDDSLKRGKEIAFDCLTRCGVSTVTIPKHVEHSLEQFYKGTRKQMDQSIVAGSLKKNLQVVRSLHPDDKLSLLDYLLETPDVIQLFKGVPLLPLEDGSFTSFCDKGDKEDIYITSEEHPKSLLPGFSRRIMSTRINPKCRRILETAADRGNEYFECMDETCMENLKIVQNLS